MEEAEQNSGVVVSGLPTSGPEAYVTSTLVHRNFDRLIGANGAQWSRDDKLDPAIFDKIKSKLGACHGIKKVASKFIAHADDAGSRGTVSEKERRVTLDRIQVCPRLICHVAAYINGPLHYIGGSNFLPNRRSENG